MRRSLDDPVLGIFFESLDLFEVLDDPAFRSGQRIRTYFESIDRGVAEAAAASGLSVAGSLPRSIRNTSSITVETVDTGAILLASTPNYDSRMAGDYFVPRTCLGGPSAYWRLPFLVEARQLRPEILRTLQKDLLPFYREHPSWPAIVGRTRLGAARRNLGKLIPLARLKAQRELLTRLKQWAKPYHLVEKCIIYETLHTLEMWRNLEENTEACELRWWSEHFLDELFHRPGAPVPVSAPRLDRRLIHPEPFRFEHIGWSVQLETGQDWKAAVRDAFEDALANHERQLQKLARKHLQTPIPNVIHRSVRWLAEYQIDSTVTYRALASRDKRSPRTIRNGVQKASRMIGLPVRPPSKGRPKGAKDSEDSPRQRAGW